MKTIKIDRKNNELVLLAQTLDDLWHLERIIEKGDIVMGNTDRKIKPSKEGEKAIRQNIFVEIRVEEATFQEFSENIRVGGIIVGGRPQEFIELKSHQSLDIRTGDKVKIIKKELKNWVIDRIKKAEKESSDSKMLVVLMDDEGAENAFINQYSINRKGKIISEKKGKRYESAKNDYFDRLFNMIKSLAPEKILLAGPGFEKDNFKKFVEEKKLKNFPRIITESTNSTGESGFRELLTTNKLLGIQKELQLAKESEIIESFLEALAKDRAEYGKQRVVEAINLGAVEKLIVSETHLMQERVETENIMDLADKMKSEVHIISSRNPQEKTIKNMGGVVAILRYKIK